MDTGALYTSVDALTRVGLVLLYVPIVLLSYWRLIPKLSVCAKRLAFAMLAAQILIIILAQVVQPVIDFDRWLWDLHEEWNIPATFAYVQLGTVGGVALLTAWLARGRPGWQRLYFVGTGLVFLFLALDEYLALHEVVPDWELRYILLGAALVGATLLVAYRSSRSSWLWHLCLLAGLAVSVAGAMIINALPIPCGSWLIFHFDGCAEFFVLEESFEFLGIWLTLIAALGHLSDVQPAPSPRASRLLYALPAFLLLLLILNALVPRLEARSLAKPAVQFKSDIVLRGYHIEREADKIGLRLYVTGRQAYYLGLGYSIHLVDQVSGESVASRDEWADLQHGIWLLGSDFAPMYRQWMDVTIPAAAPTNRAYWIVLTLWRKKEGDDFKRQKVEASGLPLLDDRQVVLGELVLPAPPSTSSTAPLAVFSNGFSLEAASLPGSAQAGETINVTFAWRADEDSSEDYAQFLHLVREDGGGWWGHDQAPLGARLPTRLWYAGLADSETWRAPLPDDLTPGRYAVFTGLYRMSDLERVPVSDAEGAPWLDNRVTLAWMNIEDS